jgi:cation diffusion facilitator CzcD-associated flavoprotein CzcO
MHGVFLKLQLLQHILQVFDAVVVCNGHFSEPNLPDIPGSDSWPGLQLHR